MRKTRRVAIVDPRGLIHLVVTYSKTVKRKRKNKKGREASNTGMKFGLDHVPWTTQNVTDR